MVPGEITSTTWALSGPAEVEDESELALRARRVMRRWDAVKKLFTENLSDVNHLRATVDAARRRFEGTLKPGPTGRYNVTLSTDEKLLYAEKLALGSVEPLFTRGPDDVKLLVEIAEKAAGFLDEIERILSRQADNSDKSREDFLKRVSEQNRKLDELLERCDLTGTVLVLRDAFFHIRNVQVWDEKNIPPVGNNDPPRQKKRLFMDMELTIEALRKILSSVPEIVSLEIKASTTLILERLIGQAGDVERRRDSARSAARAASKLAEAAPVADKDLVRLLDLASDRATNPDEIREQLLQAGQALIVK
jgi:hypothetical protein